MLDWASSLHRTNPVTAVLFSAAMVFDHMVRFYTHGLESTLHHAMLMVSIGMSRVKGTMPTHRVHVLSFGAFTVAHACCHHGSIKTVVSIVRISEYPSSAHGVELMGGH